MVNPAIWGPHGWYFIHCLELNFVQSKLGVYHTVLRLLAQILPCDTCKINYSGHLLNYPVEQIGDVNSFRNWAINMHNAVNQALGKSVHAGGYPELPPSGQKINHQRIIIFFNAIAKHAMARKNRAEILAVNRFRQALLRIFPCLTCRRRFISSRPRNMAEVIRILRK